MLKKNFKEAVERNKRFLKRQMMDGILFKVGVRGNPYAVREIRDETWTDRECLAVSEPEWVLEDCRRAVQVYQDIDDDTIPEGYPTRHFGESVYSYLLGGNVHFVGDGHYTCSGAEPMVFSEADMNKLTGFENNGRVKAFEKAARYFAKEAKGDFWLKYFICIDTLNLAVELLGTTNAYIMVSDDEALMRKIMEFGVGYNYWFYKLQKDINRKNNMVALADEEFYDLYDKTWYSIDAYDICSPQIYQDLGLEYQQQLIDHVGGGMLHTHGTGLVRLLPLISQLEGLSLLQIGRDLNGGGYLDFSSILHAREMTGDTPLQFSINEQEFNDGIKNRTLPGGVEYTCFVNDIDTANKLAAMAKEYEAPKI